MVHVTKHDPGTPNWVDIGSRDLPKTVAFYSGLFGWEPNDMGEEAGHYTMFTVNGLNVAAAGPMQNDTDPAAWMSYISVADIDASVALADANGAKVLMPPMEVMTAGKMAVLLDAEGSAFSMWQPQEHIGAQLVNEPNTFCWSELWTRNVEGAKAFYGAVFGWGSSTDDSGEMPYTEFKLGDKTIAGGWAIPAEVPAQVPSNWLIYFAVADCDATVEKAKSLGATIMKEATDIPPGRFAGITDPNGTNFAVLQFKE